MGIVPTHDKLCLGKNWRILSRVHKRGAISYWMSSIVLRIKSVQCTYLSKIKTALPTGLLYYFLTSLYHQTSSMTVLTRQTPHGAVGLSPPTLGLARPGLEARHVSAQRGLS